MAPSGHRPRTTTVAASRRSSNTNIRPVSRGSTTSARSSVSRSAGSGEEIRAHLHMNQMPSASNHDPGFASGPTYNTYHPMYSQQGSFNANTNGNYTLEAGDYKPNDGNGFEQSLRMRDTHQPHINGFARPLGDIDADTNGGGSNAGERMQSLDPESKKRKGNGSTPNEVEMLEMLESNKHRPLSAIAQEVMATERTPKGEKTKILFAMMWLSNVCSVQKGSSVPKNRVYGRYASKCGTEKVPPLNPASFGKAVRYVFPNIPTRRLGVRGESKYHYVDFSLMDEPKELPAGAIHAQTDANGAMGSAHFSASAQMPSFETFQPHYSNNINPTMMPNMSRVPSGSRGQVPTMSAVYFGGIDPHRLSNGNGRKFHQPYAYFKGPLPSVDLNERLELPDLSQYLPENTDVDSANALAALYFTHCTGLVENVRFCKERPFFRLFESLNGTMTVPVQKLFEHPSVAPWIKKCDLVTYKRIVRILATLIVDVIPPAALGVLGNIAQNLAPQIRRVFANHPNHVVEARLEPAVLFSHVLDRLVSTNRSAHAAANVLSDDNLRDQMWVDYVRLVTPERVINGNLPFFAVDRIWDILAGDLRMLLQPRNTPLGLEHGTAYQNIAIAMRAEENGTPQDGDFIAAEVLRKMAHFVETLHTRFPRTWIRINHTMYRGWVKIATEAILRQLICENAPSLANWLVTKIFIDDLVDWYLCLGGFLRHGCPPAPVEMNANEMRAMFPGASDFYGDATMPEHNTNGGANDATAFSLDGGFDSVLEANDDSGLGLSMLDTELDPKYDAKAMPNMASATPVEQLHNNT